MWFKLDKSEENCLAINSEIAYAYFILNEYIESGREKYNGLSSRMINYNIKRNYKNFKTQNILSEENCDVKKFLNLPTEEFCRELSFQKKCQISVRLSKQSQRNRKSCYRRRGELFGCYPLEPLREEYCPLLLIECNSDWPNATQFRLNLEPLQMFKSENDSKTSLWDFLGRFDFSLLNK